MTADALIESEPGALRAAAIVQLISGCVNLLIVSWLASVIWFTVGGTVSAVVMAVCTLGMCPLPVGSLCGGVGLFIAPIAVLEIVSGVIGISSPRGGRVLMITTGIIELLSVFLVNPVALVAGLVSLGLAITNR